MKGIITIILLIVFVVIVMFLDLPAYNKVGFLKNEIEKYSQFLEEKEELLVKVGQLKEIYESREEEINKVYYVLPPSADIPSLIVQFEALVSENGLILGNLSFSQVQAAKKTSKVTWEEGEGEELDAVVETEVQKTYQSLGISLSLTGSYQSFKSLLKALEYNIRLMNIKSISFSSATKTSGGEEEAGIPTYTFAVSLEAYFQ